MMTIDNAYRMIEDGVIIAGMRGAFGPENALRVTALMMEEGINAFEFTMNSDQPIEAMQAVKRELGDAACVGMGTVLNTTDAHRVLDAGADYVVSPAFQPEVVRVVMDSGVLIAPGVMTPTEAITAWDMGVRLLKIFPIGNLGLDYFKSIRGPLNHLKWMCNGGMTGDNAPQFIAAGASAVGMAGWLTGDGTMPLDEMRKRAKMLRAGIDAIRPRELA
jgi:2-dehydro-3-deoxyphosphogluconate aldolase / (4S)-4-hydroxy-2-oxoglutarate aldolase